MHKDLVLIPRREFMGHMARLGGGAMALHAP
jgi:hypothetical protein